MAQQLQRFKTYGLALKLYEQCEQIQSKRYIRDQLHRAALSIVLNVAEGSAKPTIKERKRFYAIAFGSLREVQAILEISKQEQASKLADEVGACLYTLVFK